MDRRQAAALTLKMLAIAALVFAATTRYVIGLDPQGETSIPGHRLFIIDTKDQAIHARLQMVAFRTEGLEPWFADGTRMIKIVYGLPGDMIRVRPEGAWVNGEPALAELALAEPLGLTPEQVTQDYTLGPDEYFVAGLHPKSYDSRYFGPVKASQFIGRGYAPF